MPHLEGLKVVRSKIHGYGIVTLRPFKLGETVVYGDGILWHEDDEFDDNYALVYSDDHDEQEEPNRYLDLTCQTRWINHACSPNTEVVTDLDEETGEPYAYWVALRDIPVGEELTYDYAFSGHLAETCFCGSDACLGVIVDPNEIDLVPQELRPQIKLERMQTRLAQVSLSDLEAAGKA